MADAHATSTGSDEREVFRPRAGRVLCAAIWAIAATSAVALVATEGARTVWQVAPVLAFASWLCWALFWRPAVEVDDAGVRIVNVARTIVLPWPAVRGVDTRWALTVESAYGRFTAWAAPAPGARQAVRTVREEAPHLPVQRLRAGMRPGDLPTSASGDAAAIVRVRWERLRAAGHLADPRLEHERAPITWHWRSLGVGTLLLVASVAGLVS